MEGSIRQRSDRTAHHSSCVYFVAEWARCDPVFRPNRSRFSWSPPGWYAAESRLLYGVLKALNGRGYGLIKKRLWRDGHMFGSEHTQYLRSFTVKAAPSLYVYHNNYALE